MNASEKVERFFKTAINYYGKDIAIPSDQFFCIDQVVDPEKVSQGVTPYRVQYGFPKTGAIRVDFSYSDDQDELVIDGVKVFAIPAKHGKDMFTSYPHVEKDVYGVHINVGLDNSTVEHTTLQAIDDNPNAVQFIDTATADLMQAVVLGDCALNVEEGSEFIPCSCSSPYPHEETQEYAY